MVERQARENDVYDLNRKHLEATRKNQELLDSKNALIDKLVGRLQSYQTWVNSIRRLDLTASPAESALARADFSLGLLSSSLRGATLEEAMQDLGYIDTIFTKGRNPAYEGLALCFDCDGEELRDKGVVE
jgi:hypothetical protein